MALRHRWARAAAITLGVITFTTTMQSAAWAGSGTIYVGSYGTGRFQADPSGSIPGDAIRACDTSADGFGIRVGLDIGADGDVDRIVTTEGHNSPYCSAWGSGNIAEGTSVRLWAYRIKNNQIDGANLYSMNLSA